MKKSFIITSIWLFVLNILVFGQNPTPPPFSPRTPSEWEPSSAIMFAWPNPSPIGYYDIAETVRSGIRAILDNPCEILVLSKLSSNALEKQIGPSIPFERITHVKTATERSWIRDYGPQPVLFQQPPYIGLIDWEYPTFGTVDDLIPEQLSKWLGIPYYSTAPPRWKFINVGGNFITDGFGNGFALDAVVSHNIHLSIPQIKNIMKRFNGIDRLTILPSPPHDPSAHIDLFLKMLDDETWMIPQFSAGAPPYLISYAETLAKTLSNTPSCYGRNYRLVWVPTATGGNSRNESYTNSVFINSSLLIPKYYVPQDATARFIYQQACSGYQIHQIDCSETIQYEGAIRCLTNQLVDSHSFAIRHARLFDRYTKPIQGVTGRHTFYKYENTSGFPVLASIDGPNSPSEVELWHNANGEFQTIRMQKDPMGHYAGVIPSCSAGSIVHYKILVHTASSLYSKPTHGFYCFHVLETDPCAEESFAGGTKDALRLESSTGSVNYLSSAKSVSVPPEVTLEKSRVFIDAPSVHYESPPGQWDWLAVNYDSDLSIRANRVDLAKLQVGAQAADETKIDHSQLSITSCEKTQYKNLELNSDGHVVLRSEEALVLGTTEAGVLEASIQYEPFTQATFISNQINIERPIVTMATLPNILGRTGYLEFFAPDGQVILFPQEVFSFDFSVFSSWIIHGASVHSGLAQFKLHQDGQLWMNANSKMTIEGTSIDVTDVIQEPSTLLSIQAAELDAVASSLFGQKVYVVLDKAHMGNAQIVIRTESVAVPRQNSIKTTNNALIDKLEIRASTIDLGNSSIECKTNGQVDIKAASLRITPGQRLKTDKTSASIRLGIMSRKEHETYVADLKKTLTEPVTTAKALPTQTAQTSTPLAKTQLNPSPVDTVAVAVPQEFSVHSYPNPFNPVTRIRIMLPHTGRLEVAIYDILGQQVAVLHDGPVQKGVQTLYWNATNHASGTYFCVVQGTLENGQVRKVQKLLYLK